MNLLKNPRNKNKWKLKDILYWRWHSTINLMTAGQYIKEKYMILPIILDIILEARKFYQELVRIVQLYLQNITVGLMLHFCFRNTKLVMLYLNEILLFFLILICIYLYEFILYNIIKILYITNYVYIFIILNLIIINYLYY